MTKKQVIERVRELTRQTRILRDKAQSVGDVGTAERLTDKIVTMNVFAMRLGKLDTKAVLALAEIHRL